VVTESLAKVAHERLRKLQELDDHRCEQHRQQRGALHLEESFPVKTGMVETSMMSRLKRGDAYLFHGTNPSSAMSILKTGFELTGEGDEKGEIEVCGKDEYGVYAALDGFLTAEFHCERLDAGSLVCRCYVGRPYMVDSAGDHVEVANAEGFDCVCGDRESTANTYREFVFFDEALVYPEFTVIYRRQWVAEKVPENMQVSSSGTTGRFWQFRGDIFGFRGWKNVPTELNKLLTARRSEALNM